MKSKLHFHKHYENLVNLLSHASILISPSLYLYFGISIQILQSKLSLFPRKLPRLPFFLSAKNVITWPLILIHLLIYPHLLIPPFNQAFNQVKHRAILLCINSFACLEINHYWTGLKCVSYSVTQVKIQLHESILELLWAIPSADVI